MPRSTKATARTSTASKRTSKRSVSKQRDIYAIPESPQSSVASDIDDASSCTNENEIDTSSCRNPSPAPDDRGRSMSVASTKVSQELDCTPTQAKPTRSRTASLEPQQLRLPGFEALDAVNGLYQKLKDGQDENDQLKQENWRLVKETQDHKKQIRSLQIELQAEKERTKAAQIAQDKIDQAANKTAQEDLNTVLNCLRNFSLAAYKLMPLLDVLTDAPDIQYDEATERLYEIIKQHNEQNGHRKSIDAKIESSRSKE